MNKKNKRKRNEEKIKKIPYIFEAMTAVVVAKRIDNTEVEQCACAAGFHQPISSSTVIAFEDR